MFYWANSSIDTMVLESRIHRFLLMGIALFSQTTLGAGPIIALPYGAFQGATTGTSSSFLGIPYAAPPTGNYRFAPPQPPIPFNGTQQATSFGFACLQQTPPFPSGFPINPPIPANQSEDCLFLNVFQPTELPAGEMYPVLVYFFGGAFGFGDSSWVQGGAIVNRSIELNEPVIFVTVNYRLNAFGFLGGSEAQQAGIGNAGLRDQTAALQWIQAHIAYFGGDPSQVTLWGVSSGAISIGLHMIINDGDTNGLFTGGIMQSGSVIPLAPIQTRQKYFDFLVDSTNCTNSSDRLQCLRSVPSNLLHDAVNQTPTFYSYQSLDIPWFPTIDGDLITQDPFLSLQQGKYAKIPFIAGNTEDEGTVFSACSLNITNGTEFLNYVKTNYFTNISDSQLAAIDLAYPSDPALGSPFHTGTVDALTPQYKRLSAFQGDLVLQTPRRNLLSIASKTQPAWSYRYLRGASTPEWGASHTSDAGYFLGQGIDLIALDYVLNFANHGDPNPSSTPSDPLTNITWGEWSSSPNNPPLLTFIDAPGTFNITTDTYREDAIYLLSRLLSTNSEVLF